MGKIVRVVTPQEALDRWAGDFAPMVRKTLKHNDGSYDEHRVLSELLDGSSKMIVCENHDATINAVCIGSFRQGCDNKVFLITFLCSDDASLFKDRFLNFAFEYAKNNNATSVQVCGRRGWKRFLSDYDFKEIYTILERKL